MSTEFKVKYLVKPRYYDSDVATYGYIDVYCSSGLVKRSTQRIQFGKEGTIVCQGAAVPDKLFVHVHAIREAARYTTYIGKTVCTLDGKPFKLMDPVNEPVGTVSLTTSVSSSSSPSTAVTQYDHKTDLGDTQFDMVPSSAGSVPIWVMPYHNMVKPFVNGDAHEMLNNLRVLACGYTGISSISEVRAELCELIAEMCAMIPMHALYKVDISKRVFGDITVDMWTNLLENPDLSLMVYDCEDGSLSIMEISHLLKSVTLPSDSPLVRVQQMERQYVTAMCIGTLLLPSSGTVVSHSYVVKLDPRFFSELNTGATTRYFPPIVIDPTNYNGSSYESKSIDNGVFENSDIRLDGGETQTRRKLPTDQTFKVASRLYLTVEMLVCPEFIDKYGFGTVRLTSNTNDRPVSFVDLYNYSPTIKRTYQKPMSKEAIKKEMSRYTSTVIPFGRPLAPIETELKLVKLDSIGEYDDRSMVMVFQIRMRKVDYKKEHLSKIMKEKQLTHIKATSYHIIHGLEGVRIQGFRLR